jgi:hypothetical protein
MKKTLFYFFLALLLLPAMQKEVHILKLSPLEGSFHPAKDIRLSLNRWFKTEYQTSKETFLKENIGFRPAFVRGYNQILYSLFNMAHNPGGVVGKDNYLYLESYIFNKTGENFVGYSKINTISTRLKYLQDYFSQHNINLLTVFVPSKASFFPEYIPDRYQDFPINNYQAYLNKFDSLNINYIDLNKYLIDQKETAAYPMFSKNGLHWTDYGMALGMDSLIKKIEDMRHADLPEFSWEEPIKLSPMTFVTDYDAENLMNILIEMPRDSMPYPKFNFSSDSGKTKPKTVVISDSYYWRAYKAKIPHHVFRWGGFWYYFNTARDQANGKEQISPVKKFNLKKKLLQQDVIILFASQATLHIFPYGFVEKVYPLIIPADLDLLTKYYRKKIINNADWMEKIKEKAKRNNFSVDEQISKDALWMAKRHPKK